MLHQSYLCNDAVLSVGPAGTDRLWAHLRSDRKGTGFCLTTQPALPHGDGRMRYGETFGRWIPSEKIAHHNSTSFATASSFQRHRTLATRGAKHENIVSQRPNRWLKIKNDTKTSTIFKPYTYYLEPT